MTLREIRKEFDEPIPEIIKGFAVLGYSKRATADVLEIQRDTFRRLCTLYAPDAPWRNRKELREDCKPYNRTRKYSDEYLIDVLRQFPPDISGPRFDKVAPVSLSTYLYRFGSWQYAKRLAHDY